MIVVEEEFVSKGGGVKIWVVIEPSADWRPWPHRWSRWWWELHFQRPGDDAAYTCAYTDGGSGGTFTLRRAMQKASTLIWDFFWEGDWEEDPPVEFPNASEDE